MNPDTKRALDIIASRIDKTARSVQGTGSIVNTGQNFKIDLSGSLSEFATKKYVTSALLSLEEAITSLGDKPLAQRIVKVHKQLAGLDSDDHTQYHTDTRADTWLGGKSLGDLGTKDHHLLTGLSDDDHTQYLLLAGRAGGQVGYGGTESGDTLTLAGSSHGTSGGVAIADFVTIDECLGVGTAPDATASLKLATIPAVSSDVDKILMSDSGVVKYAGGLDLLNYISPVGSVAQVWKTRTMPVTSTHWGVAYGAGLFVSVGNENGSSCVYYSPDGVTWAIGSHSYRSNYFDVCYGNGRFVAVGGSSGSPRVMVSYDGRTWANASVLPAGNSADGVCYGNGQFVAVFGDGATSIMTSPDGFVWTARASASASNWQKVCWGNGLFVAVAQLGTNRIQYSADGISWTEIASTTQLFDVRFANGLFVAVGYDGTNNVLTSLDGVTWTPRTSAFPTYPLRAITYGNGVWVCQAANGHVMVSIDATTWSDVSATPGTFLGGDVTYGGNVFVAVGSGGAGSTQSARTSGAVSWGLDELVHGPEVSTNNALVVWDGATGRFVKDSSQLIGDFDNFLYKPGVSGGQIAYGGTASGDSLTLAGSAHADGGPLIFLGSGGAEVARLTQAGKLGLGKTPGYAVDIFNNTDGEFLRAFGSNADGVRMSLRAEDTNSACAVLAYDDNDGGTGAYTTLVLGTTYGNRASAIQVAPQKYSAGHFCANLPTAGASSPQWWMGTMAYIGGTNAVGANRGVEFVHGATTIDGTNYLSMAADYALRYTIDASSEGHKWHISQLPSAADEAITWTEIMRANTFGLGIGRTPTQDRLEVAGAILALDKIKFTQADGNEYIDSLADGYMDYGATNAHRFAGSVVLNSENNVGAGGDGSPDVTITTQGYNSIVVTPTSGSEYYTLDAGYDNQFIVVRNNSAGYVSAYIGGCPSGYITLQSGYCCLLIYDSGEALWYSHQL